MNQTAAAAKGLNENQTLKTYEKKVKEDIRLMHENLHEMLKLLKIDDDKTLKVIFLMNFLMSLKIQII
jgi:hypothetical protein